MESGVEIAKAIGKPELILLYVVIVGLLGIIFYLLKIVLKEMHEITRQLASITEWFRNLVQAAFDDRRRGGRMD